MAVPWQQVSGKDVLLLIFSLKRRYVFTKKKVGKEWKMENNPPKPPYLKKTAVKILVYLLSGFPYASILAEF